MLQIVFATKNINKLNEARLILRDLPHKIIGLDKLSGIPEIDETGSTLLENALLKARTVYKITGLPTFADDTGLEVKSLNGAPGVRSARYAGVKASSSDNLERLLKEMEGLPVRERSAQFRTVIALKTDSDEEWIDGIVKGLILHEPKGESGFGYDPVFYYPPLKSTFAELSMEEKNKISHRGFALEKFRILLDKYNFG